MSNKRIFLDVGANTGQTLKAVLDPAFKFDQVFCFEPVRSCWTELQRLAFNRKWSTSVFIKPYGLWNKTECCTIYGPGNKGASLWKKDNHPKWATTELCSFVRASDWFKEYLDESCHDETCHTVYMKLNCEGAECDILDDLLDSGEFRKVSYVMVDFDVRKIESQRHREAEIRARLEREGICFPRIAFSKDVMKGDTHQERIKSWLIAIGAQMTGSMVL